MKTLSKILLALKLTCKDTSPLISEMMDHSLPLLDRWRVKLHLAMCEFCRYYQEQLEVLRKLSRYLGQEDAQTHNARFLTQERKGKIKSLLKNQY
jgi:predicted anti-sigma-YlaC factor YlaD